MPFHTIWWRVPKSDVLETSIDPAGGNLPPDWATLSEMSDMVFPASLHVSRRHPTGCRVSMLISMCFFSLSLSLSTRSAPCGSCCRNCPGRGSSTRRRTTATRRCIWRRSTTTSKWPSCWCVRAALGSTCRTSTCKRPCTWPSKGSTHKSSAWVSPDPRPAAFPSLRRICTEFSGVFLDLFSSFEANLARASPSVPKVQPSLNRVFLGFYYCRFEFPMFFCQFFFVKSNFTFIDINRFTDLNRCVESQLEFLLSSINFLISFKRVKSFRRVFTSWWYINFYRVQLSLLKILLSIFLSSKSNETEFDQVFLDASRVFHFSQVI